MSMHDLRNWRLEFDHGAFGDGFCRLTLDVPDARQNVLSTQVIQELDSALAEIERVAPAGVIVQSAKDGFIAGADVTEFGKIESSAAALQMIETAHGVMDRLEALPMPSVAVINGHCLGGGLELALACDYRVACDAPTIRIGLPEVLLGIHPGFGGCARLIELIGAPAAMGMMLSGRTLAPRAAKRIGIVDISAPRRQLQRSAQHILLRRPKPRRMRRDWKRLFNLAPARIILAAVMRKRVAARAREAQYPAPYRLIDLWRKYGGDRAAMLRAEPESVANLITTQTSRNLVRVFFLREGLKRSKADDNDNNFTHAHVIGAGTMGGDIAAWCALRGLTASVHDSNADALAQARKRAHQLFTRWLKAPRQVQGAMDRLWMDCAGDGVRRADVIIEAIVERADAKAELFAALQSSARDDALLATNTSSIPLESLCDSLRAPQRLVGLHFFNPVARMELVEIVRGERTDPAVAARAAAFARAIGRLPITVKSRPGFLVNRILMPYLLEAVTLLAEGASRARIDRAATEFGMPLGPIALADTVGLDVCLQVAQNLTEHYGGEVPAILRDKVEAGHLGRKSGQGFHRWSNGKLRDIPIRRAKRITNVQDRLILRFLNEAVACLREGIVDSADELDAGMIFGAGFAPFRGGPMRYVRDEGQAKLRQRLIALHERHGERFAPDAGWDELDLGERAE